MSYTLEQIPASKGHPKNKYQYLDHVETLIEIKYNYWSFDMQLYLINNYNLPPGLIVGELDLPYQQVKDLTFNLATDQSEASKRVTELASYAKIFESKFDVDVSNNELFKQDISNAKINCSIKLEVDPQIIKNAGVQLEQERVDALISETSTQSWDFEMYYTNTNLINGSDKVLNQFGYALSNNHECMTKFRIVDVSSNDYSSNIEAINDLVTIQSDTVFQVISAKVKFYYWLDNQAEQKELETVLRPDRSLTKNLQLSVNRQSLYDYTNNKVTWDVGGITGFYIPKLSHGYYELELLINQDCNVNKFIIKNPFVFIKDVFDPYIGVSHIVITDVTDYKKVEN